MTLFRRIFVFALIGAAFCNAALCADCNNPTYRKQNPYKCAIYNNSNLALGGIAAMAAGAAAFAISASGGGAHNSNGNSGPIHMPTLQTYDMRGDDISYAQLAGIINTEIYNRNINQYNDIRLAYSVARGYSGAGTDIAILDNGPDSWHGQNIAYIANAVAPNATIIEYQITDHNGEFLSYSDIGEIIKSNTGPATIFNASWSTSMLATDIRTRAQFEHLTGTTFIGAISHAATNNDAIFVWAAGNDSAPQSSALSAMPRIIPELSGHFINVVAWDSETGALADYSNACGITRDYCITAPGSDIETPTSIVSGTSFAAPIVSAAVATLREAFPYMSAPEITSLLFETARDIGAPGIDNVYGRGMLDMERATRPVGAALVPVGEEMMAPLRTAHVPGPIARNVKQANLRFAYFDKYGRPFQTTLSDHISTKNPSRAWRHLRGDNKIGMKIGAIELGFRNDDFILGEGLLRAERKNTIGYIGTERTQHIGRAKITSRIYMGQSRPTPVPESMISEFSTIYTLDAKLGINIDGWAFSIAAPDTFIHGNMRLRTPVGRANNGAIIYSNQDVDISMFPALEYTIGYKFLSATFIDNPYGNNEVFFMAKTRLIF